MNQEYRKDIQEVLHTYQGKQLMNYIKKFMDEKLDRLGTLSIEDSNDVLYLQSLHTKYKGIRELYNNLVSLSAGSVKSRRSK